MHDSRDMTTRSFASTAGPEILSDTTMINTASSMSMTSKTILLSKTGGCSTRYAVSDVLSAKGVIRRVGMLFLGGLLWADAKYQTGTLNLGPAAQDQMIYVSKMGYGLGDGSYEIRFKATRPPLTKPTKVRLAVFLDEEWESERLEHLLHLSHQERNSNVCDILNHTKSTREVLLPGGMTPEWSALEKGGLKQVIRPHVWYFVVHNCMGDFTERTRLKWEFRARQEGGSEFSSEQEGMLWVYLLKLILFGAYGVHYYYLCVKFREEDLSESLHPVIWVLTTIIGLQFFSTAFHYIHLLSYSSNGSGIKAFDVLDDVMQNVSQVLIQSLLILIASGYTLLQDNLGDLDVVIPVVLIVTLINVLLVGFSKMKDDASFKFHEAEGITGWIMCMVRMCLYFWFLLACQGSRKAATKDIGVLLRKIMIGGTIYFLSYPIIYVITSLFAAYLRNKVITLLSFISFGISVRWLEAMFLKKGDFTRVSSVGGIFLPGGRSSGGMELRKLE